MLQKHRLGLAAAAVALLALAPLRAQQAEPQIEPEAMEVLQKAGAYMRTLTAFQVTATTTKEDVLVDGQKVAQSAVVDLVAARPNRARVSVQSDRRDRTYFYDGKSFTLFAQRANLYATVDAPGTIAELADVLDSDYGMTFPLVDLFYWGTERAKDDEITSAMFIGPSEVDGVTCGHYAFRQPGLDWQAWIQMGDFPLPRRVVLTTTTDEARPQYQATYSWNLAPSYNDESFTFTPPSGAARVVLGTEEE